MGKEGEGAKLRSVLGCWLFKSRLIMEKGTCEQIFEGYLVGSVTEIK